MSIILFLGVPTMILWAVASTLGWADGYGPTTFLTIFEIISLLATVGLPVIGTYRFSKSIANRRKLSETSSQSDAVRSLDEDFQLVLSDEFMLVAFEK